MEYYNRLEQVCAASVLSRTKVLCGTLTGFASSLQDLGTFLAFIVNAQTLIVALCLPYSPMLNVS